MPLASQDMAAIAAWVRASSPGKVRSPMGGWTHRGPYAVLWPVNPAVASYPDLSGLGPRSLLLYAPAVALSAPVLDHRLGWSCEALPAASERLRHMLFHRWDLPRPLTVGIASPSQSVNAALAAEGLNVDLTETAVLAVPLYAITSKDRANVQEVCRSTYAVAA